MKGQNQVCNALIENPLTVDGDRLWESLMQLARVGATPRGGVKRLALTELDKQGRDLVVGWGKAIGLAVTVDKIGNIFMRRAGKEPHAAPVVSGSHIDTQPTGGRFDGNFGVLAALEVLGTLDDHNIQTLAPIEVAIWTNEEGSRFVPVMMGSGVFCGAFSLDLAYAAKDIDGLTVREELERIGYIGAEHPGDHPIEAYFEAHIEQGPVLEDANVVIGVVPAVLGLAWYDCVVTGMEAHAGPTPMHLRKDALQVATGIMQKVVAVALRYQPYGRGTVGMVQVFPNSRNVIPGKVTFSIDLRNVDETSLSAMCGEIEAFVTLVAKESGLAVSLNRVSYFPPCPFDSRCIDSVRTAISTFGYSSMDVVSGAGHDAIYAARVVPAGMIFVPCKDGISHNETEDARPEHLTAGCNVLLHAILDHARVANPV
jgi:N-carbamoyl-L-amino-acid hydrolase